MSELENIGGTRKQLDTDIRKRLNNSFLPAAGEDFSIFIDRALAETQIAGTQKDEAEPKKIKLPPVKDEETEETAPQKKTRWTVTPEITYQKETLQNKNKENTSKNNPVTPEYQNLNAAFQLVEQRLA
jgi:hypothetical protein